MASNINPNNVDGAYPVAGQDNDSQGFRDNFTNIKTSLQFAKEEIEALQDSTVVLNDVNNMAGGTIVGAKIQDLREVRVALPTGSAILTLDHSYGHYYSVVSGSTMQVAFAGWPAVGEVGRVRLQVTVSSVSDTLQLPVSVVQGLVGLAGFDATTRTITFKRTGVHEFQFTSHDGGNTFTVEDLTRAQTAIDSPAPASAIGKAGDVAGLIATDATYFYVCTGSYDGTTHIWKRLTLLTW